VTGEEPIDFSEMIGAREVVVCVGSGGVGKTTTSAVIALREAVRGRKVLVLTIDPARRLANSLGVEELTNEVTRIPIERFEEIGLSPEGELWAMMLDMKASFDDVVRQNASDETREQILNNRIYQYFSTSLAGTQEYAAAERLHALHEEGDFDLIVLDTPPTTHALDFLDAPRRLEEAIENKALQWLYKPSVLAGKAGLGIFSLGTSYVMKTIGKLTGTQLLEEFSVFLSSFSTLFDGLRDRSRAVRQLLLSDVTAFVVVTAPDPLTIEEAIEFHRKLGKEEVQVGGFVVNRVHPHWAGTAIGDPDDEEHLDQIVGLLGEAAGSGELGEQRRRHLARTLLENAAAFDVLARMDTACIEKLRRSLPERMPIRRVPYFARDIHSLDGLDMARMALFGDGSDHVK